jgi:outer membrane protein assembly factor BamA
MQTFTVISRRAGAHALVLMCAFLFLIQSRSEAHQQPSANAPVNAPGGEHVAEVRIHGNHTTPDDAVIKLTGITLGDPVTAETLPQVAQRLRDSGRFKDVDVLKRYRSLADPSQVSLIVVVHEYPSVDPGIPGAPLPPVPGPIRRLLSQSMFLPIISYAEGYGFTYGARASFVDVLGEGGRISVPLTWGGTRRAALEIEKTFDDDMPMSRVFSRVQAGAGISRRENPHFELPDTRQQIWGRVDKDLLRELRVGGGVSWTDVGFGLKETPSTRLDNRFTTVGVDVTVDTRHDPIFPRNAVYAQAGWERLNFSDGPSINRYRNEARGYLGVIGQSVLAVRALHQRVDRPLPLYEQALLGGASLLRGFHAGSFAGDNLFASSVELRVPLSSPMNVGRLGVSAFADMGAVYGHGVRLRDTTLHKGVGGGVFMLATLFQLNLDVAYGIDNKVRVHFMTGFQF